MTRRDPSFRSPPWCGECNQHRDDCDCAVRAEAIERERLAERCYRREALKAEFYRMTFFSPWERRHCYRCMLFLLGMEK
jgi:hypothetical protein